MKIVDRMLINLHGENAPLLEEHVLYSIDTNYIGYIDGGLKDPECREKLIEYYTHKGLWRKMEEAFKEVYPHHEYSKEAMLKDDHFGHPHVRHNYEWNVPQGECLDMTEAIKLERTKYVDRDFFQYFFSYRLSARDSARLFDFLTYNFIHQFGGDIVTVENIRDHKGLFDAYYLFLERVIIADYAGMIGENKIKIIRDYISTKSSTTTSEPSTIELKPIQHALMLFIEREATKYQWKNKKNELRKYAEAIGVGPSAFEQNFFDLQKEFKAMDKNLIPKIQAILPHLDGKSKNWATQKIIDISKSK
jgi:hypothetical protein